MKRQALSKGVGLGERRPVIVRTGPDAPGGHSPNNTRVLA